MDETPSSEHQPEFEAEEATNAKHHGVWKPWVKRQFDPKNLKITFGPGGKRLFRWFIAGLITTAISRPISESLFAPLKNSKTAVEYATASGITTALLFLALVVIISWVFPKTGPEQPTESPMPGKPERWPCEQDLTVRDASCGVEVESPTCDQPTQMAMTDPGMTTESSITEAKKTGIGSKAKVYLPIFIGIGIFVVASAENYFNPGPSGPLTADDIDRLASQSVAGAQFTFMMKCALIGFAFGIASAVGTWLALLIIAWIWYFLLARLRELSNAVRGN